MARSSSCKTASKSMVVLSPITEKSDSRGVTTSPLHSASLHISELTESYNNPQPRRSAEDGNELTRDQEFLSPVKLMQITGEMDLNRVTYLELVINTAENSMGNFGAYLPNLTQLRFTNSTVPCIRDLGTSLSKVKVLWMSRCKLKDLDGLPALANLQEFYLAFNNVEDISIITMLSGLEVLDLESNNISEVDQLGYLALCTSLMSLTLEGNPLSITLAETKGSESGYRDAIHESIPGIKILDDVPFDSEEVVKKSGKGSKEEDLACRSSLFVLSEAGMEEDWQILQHSIKHGVKLDQEGVVSPVSRPKTAPPRPSSLVSLSPPPSDSVVDECSELTHGLNQVICGNPVRALKARRQHALTSPSAYITKPISPDGYHSPGCSPISEDVTVTRTVSEENLFIEDTQQPDHFTTSNRLCTPTPPKVTPPPQLSTPPKAAPLSRLPTPPLRLPTPPKTTLPLPTRPKSVADFRHRRYRKLSTEISQCRSTSKDHQ